MLWKSIPKYTHYLWCLTCTRRSMHFPGHHQSLWAHYCSTYGVVWCYPACKLRWCFPLAHLSFLWQSVKIYPWEANLTIMPSPCIYFWSKYLYMRFGHVLRLTSNKVTRQLPRYLCLRVWQGCNSRSLYSLQMRTDPSGLEDVTWQWLYKCLQNWAIDWMCRWDQTVFFPSCPPIFLWLPQKVSDISCLCMMDVTNHATS